LPVASDLETNEFSYLVSKNAYRSMADNHLWFSIFAHHVPILNKFTRVQRCTCCFVFLFMSLLMNIIYYDTPDTNATTVEAIDGLSFGSFYFAKEQVTTDEVSVNTKLSI
jgi:hypothetical protein